MLLQARKGLFVDIVPFYCEKIMLFDVVHGAIVRKHFQVGNIATNSLTQF